MRFASQDIFDKLSRSTDKADQQSVELGKDDTKWISALGVRQSISAATRFGIGIRINDWDDFTSGGFYRDYSASRVVLLRDRVFVGAAADNYGEWTSSHRSWLSSMTDPAGNTLDLGYTERDTVLSVISAHGNNSSLFATKTSDSENVPSGPDKGSAIDSIGSISIAIANDIDRLNHLRDKLSVWAWYGEAIRYPGSGYGIGLELQSINFGREDTVANPFAGMSEGSSVGHWIGAGGAKHQVQDSTLAIGVFGNGARFRKGVVFFDNGLVKDGDGYMIAIDMPVKAKMSWKYSGSERAIAGWLTSTNQNAELAVGIDLSETGFSIVDRSGKVQFRVSSSPGSVNYPLLMPARRGSAAIFTTSGGDHNVGLVLRPMGLGSVHIENGDREICFEAQKSGIGFFGSNATVSRGWQAPTGISDRSTFATYTSPSDGPLIGAGLRDLSDHVETLSQHVKAIIDALREESGYGLFRN